MAKTSTLSIGSSVWGDGVAQNASPAIYSNAAAPGKQETAAWVIGDNNVVAPVGAKHLQIENLSADVTLKGIAGDTGFPMLAGKLAVLPVVAGVTYVVTAAAAATADLTWL